MSFESTGDSNQSQCAWLRLFAFEAYHFLFNYRGIFTGCVDRIIGQERDLFFKCVKNLVFTIKTDQFFPLLVPTSFDQPGNDRFVSGLPIDFFKIETPKPAFKLGRKGIDVFDILRDTGHLRNFPAIGLEICL